MKSEKEGNQTNEEKLWALDMRVLRIVGGDSMDGIKSEKFVYGAIYRR